MSSQWRTGDTLFRNRPEFEISIRILLIAIEGVL